MKSEDRHPHANVDGKEQKKIASPGISLPKGGGAIQGIGETFQPNPFSGTLDFSIPIPVTPSRGFEPGLSLDYHSGSGNSPWGIGFSVALPNVSRRTERGIPRYDNSDVFLFSQAEELVPLNVSSPGEGRCDGNHGEQRADQAGNVWNVTRYVPRIEGLFARIEFWEGACDSFWKVTTKDNVTSLYGQTAQARICDPDDERRIFSWLLEHSFDPKGNRIEYVYRAEDSANLPNILSEMNRSYVANRYIHEIRYGNYKGAESEDWWAFQVVFDYGEYDISPSTLDTAGCKPHIPAGSWPVRPDPFSSYRSGFEIRTCRLCRNILLFHNFPDELGTTPALVKALCLDYAGATSSDATGNGQVANVAQLRGVTLKGFAGQPDGSYYCESFPTLRLSYTGTKPTVEGFEKIRVERGNAEDEALNLMRYQLVDLYGDGIPGFLQSDSQSVHYFRAKSDGAYAPPAYPERFPLERDLEDGRYSLVSLDGSGKLDLCVGMLQRGGYYEGNPDGTWTVFRDFERYTPEFTGVPNELVDVSGNGSTDVFIMESESAARIYPSLRRDGFASPIRTDLPVDFPNALRCGEAEAVGFADMFGDGLSHRVRVRDGSVECWPCLGHGRFGEKVLFSNPPRFEGAFNPKRLRFADVDGSGTTDLAYIYPDRVEIFFNRSGSSFDGVFVVKLPEAYGTSDDIFFGDVKGNGTSCLVFSKRGEDIRHYYCDFSAGVKPYLLMEADNGFGTLTRVRYASSAKYYLEDLEEGRGWRTKLPFPVSVVERVESLDLISGARFTQSYRYHEGCYDYVEKEFRGFGFVEEWDTDDYEAFQRPELFGDLYVSRDGKTLAVEAQLHVPPVHIKRWYHTGIALSGVCGCFTGDAEAHDLPASAIDEETVRQGGENLRQAYRALKGALLREETYALDDRPGISEIPYSVTENRYQVRQIQPAPKEGFGVFFTVPMEAIQYHYERNADDPRVAHAFTLKTDDFGNVLESCEVAYPRRSGPRAFESEETGREAQAKLCATANLARYASCMDGKKGENWVHSIPCESRAFELGGLKITPNGYFSYQDIQAQVWCALENIIRHDGKLSLERQEARLCAWTRDIFWDDAQKNVLPIGDVGGNILPHHSEEAAFSSELAEQLFDFPDKFGEPVEHMLAHDGGYGLSEEYWWNRGTVLHYFQPGEEGYCLPRMEENSFAEPGAPTYIRIDYRYDLYRLALVETRRYLDAERLLTERVAIDYRTMQPVELRDVNDNVAQVVFDALGNVIASTVHGMIEGRRYGDGDSADYRVVPDGSFADVVANGERYLQDMTSFFYYDLHAWERERRPACFANVLRETHVSEEREGGKSALQIHIGFTDGFGRELETKQRAAPGEAVLWDEDGNPVFAPEGNLAMGHVEKRWAVSGRTVFDNKGNAVKQYLPYFSSIPGYERQAGVDTALPLPTILHYDPLSRVVRSDTPKGFFSKVEFSPWRTATFDENDTVKDAPFYRKFMEGYPACLGDDRQRDEQDALDKAAAFYDTPYVAVFDSHGYSIMEIACDADGKKLVTCHDVDVNGDIARSIDPRLFRSNREKETNYFNFRYIRDMAGTVLRTESADAGATTTLNDVHGNIVHTWNGRGFHTHVFYDALGRPVRTEVRGGEENSLRPRTVERVVYGEDWEEGMEAAKERNLLGNVFCAFDQAGRTVCEAYDLTGNPLVQLRQLRREYKQEADWGCEGWDNAANALLEDEVFRTACAYDALGRPVAQTMPDGSVVRPEYDAGGSLYAVTLDSGNPGGGKRRVVDRITYDANGQRLELAYSNDVCTVYRYEPSTLRLTGIKTVRSGDLPGEMLQDMSYSYDPAGNVTRVRDNTYDVVFHDGQIVEPLWDYTYDALYRLVRAEGRRHPGVDGEKLNPHREFFNAPSPHLNDGGRLERYIQKYSYDDAGNLLTTKQTAPTSSWTRCNEIEPGSNRTVATWLGQDRTPTPYDACGNLKALENLRHMEWDHANQLVRVDVVVRSGGTNDSDYYVYDSSGDRVRKLTERFVSDGVLEVEEKSYLGNYEVKRIRRVCGEHAETVLERNSVHVMDDTRRVAIAHFWSIDRSHRETERPGTGILKYQLSNGMDSACLELDEDGRIVSYEEYYPYGGTSLLWGRNMREVNAKEYRYCGKERDATTGLYYYGARYYPPWLGRWLNPDPAGDIDGLNLYVFVGGNPATMVDEKGCCKRGKRERKESKTTSSTRPVKRQKLITDFLKPVLAPDDPSGDSITVSPLLEQSVAVSGSSTLGVDISEKRMLTEEIRKTLLTQMKEVLVRAYGETKKHRLERNKQGHETLRDKTGRTIMAFSVVLDISKGNPTSGECFRGRSRKIKSISETTNNGDIIMTNENGPRLDFSKKSDRVKNKVAKIFFTELKKLLPDLNKPHYLDRTIMTCAEFLALNKALIAGAERQNLAIMTIWANSGLNAPPCKNCTSFTLPAVNEEGVMICNPSRELNDLVKKLQKKLAK